MLSRWPDDSAQGAAGTERHRRARSRARQRGRADAWIHVSVAGVDLVTIEARVVVASIETYLTRATRSPNACGCGRSWAPASAGVRGRAVAPYCRADDARPLRAADHRAARRRSGARRAPRPVRGDDLTRRPVPISTPLTIFTIGHSTRPIDEFIRLLKGHDVRRVIDVRTLPRSRHNPQFNRDRLSPALHRARIHYRHMPGLGGLRRPGPIREAAARNCQLSRLCRLHADTGVRGQPGELHRPRDRSASC